MSNFASYIPYIQISLSILLVAAILLQQSGSSLGGAFGGSDNWSSAFHTRRGFEKFLFYGTIIISALFALTSLMILTI